MPSRKSDARRSIADDSEMPPAQHDTPAPPSEALAAAHLTSETPSAAPTVPPESTTTGGGGEHKGKSKADQDTITIEDLTLPKSIITRLAKGVLPPNTQIQANAILALSKSATVFISHLANAANEITLMSGKKTIMPPDVFRALDDVEYGFMRDRLEAEFAKFNETQSTKRSAYRKKVSAAKKAQQAPNGSVVGADESMMSTGTGLGDETSLMANTTVGTEAGESRAVKKVKVDSASGDGRMEVDGEERGGEGEVSDAETVPDEEVEEDESGDEEQEEDEEEASEEEGDDRGRGGEDDELDERPNRGLEDEALDDDDDSE